MRRTAITLSALTVLTLPAAAEQTIGSAAAIQKDVRGGDAQLKPGDQVFFNEVLTTGTGSSGKFSFVDSTNLQMGPSSRVKLDNFVYSGGSGVGFNAAKGAFRFVSAPGEHKPYEVKTPTATIGVRGTIFAARVLPDGRTDAVIYSGVIEVCNTAGVCRTLDNPCTFVTVTNASISEPKTVGKNDWSFDLTCKGAPLPTEQGSAPPPPPPAGRLGDTGALLTVGGIIGSGVAGGIIGSQTAPQVTLPVTDLIKYPPLPNLSKE